MWARRDRTSTRELDEKIASRCLRRRGHGRSGLRSDACQRRAVAAQRRPGSAAGQEVLDRPARRAPAVGTLARRARGRADPARRDRPPVARASTTSRGCSTARTTRCAVSGDKIEVWVANDTAFPAGDCRAQIPDSTHDHRRAGRAAWSASSTATCTRRRRRPSARLLTATAPTRILGPDANGNGGVYTGGGEKTVALIDNVRDDNYYTFPAAPTYIAGLLLVAVQRAARPQRHDDRRLRLGAPDRRRTRRTSRRPICARAARRARTSTRARSRTSGSTSCTTTPTRSRRRGSTRGSPTSPRR